MVPHPAQLQGPRLLSGRHFLSLAGLSGANETVTASCSDTALGRPPCPSPAVLVPSAGQGEEASLWSRGRESGSETTDPCVHTACGGLWGRPRPNARPVWSLPRPSRLLPAGRPLIRPSTGRQGLALAVPLPRSFLPQILCGSLLPFGVQ